MQTLLVPQREVFGPDARTLFVFCGYQSAPPPRETIAWRIARRLRLTAICENARRVRDYHANPRGLDYMLALSREFRDANKVAGPVFAMIDKRLGPATEVSAEASFAAPVDTFEVRDDEAIWRWCKSHAINPAAVVLFYADAIGLGCANTEDAASAGAAQVIVVNGRRRAFGLDASARRALALRRVLSNWRFMEAIFAMTFLVVAIACCVVDAAQSKEVEPWWTGPK